MIGHGRLKRVAKRIARSWVLSPISARATSATEVKKASKGVVLALCGSNARPYRYVQRIASCHPHRRK
jgi:hypothetical protein